MAHDLDSLSQQVAPAGTTHWGEAPQRYCAAGPEPVDQRGSLTLDAISKQLEQRFPGLRQRVEQAFKDSNTPLREALRTETGLRLSNEKTRRNIPVRVVNGIPQPFFKTLPENAQILDLYLDVSLFRKSVEGLRRLQQQYCFLETLPQLAPSLARREELAHSGQSLTRLIAELEHVDLFDAFWRIQEDILGTYFFRQGCIELYWMPIGLIAADLDVTPEALTQVVATHELAHAYTHLGFDIDDRTWTTSKFAAAGIDVVEGIAQFFTEAVCERMESRWPGMNEAYFKLLKKQSGPYRVHLDWFRDGEAGGEVVRNALIMYRALGGWGYEAFKDMLRSHKELLGLRKREPMEAVIVRDDSLFAEQQDWEEFRLQPLGADDVTS